MKASQHLPPPSSVVVASSELRPPMASIRKLGASFRHRCCSYALSLRISSHTNSRISSPSYRGLFSAGGAARRAWTLAPLSMDKLKLSSSCCCESTSTNELSSLHAFETPFSRGYHSPVSSPLEESHPTPETVPKSKNEAKKEATKREKEKRKAEATAASAVVHSMMTEENNPLSQNYGDVSFNDLPSKEASGRMWAKVKSLDKRLEDQSVLVRGRVHSIRAVGKKMAFVVLKQSGYTVQCVVTVEPGMGSPQMVHYAAGLSRESLIDVEGLISIPPVPIKGTSQEVEIRIRKIHCNSRSLPILPINIEDASRSEEEIEKALQAGEQLVRVNQDTRLNYRVLDMRTPANRALFRIESKVANFFRQFLLNEEFDEIFTPRIIAGSSEGGATVFSVDYYGERACLAQSPQFHKQMAICGDFERVFVVGPVYRAENSFTHRHLCEFIGLDVEMEIMEHYSEVMDIVDRLFVAMFDYLNRSCSKELEDVRIQHPFHNLKFMRKTLRLTFEEGVKMLQEAGVTVDPHGDLNSEAERKLGQLVFDRYGTEFFILHRYPLAVRPFYTMPCYDDPTYSNSFDVFLRGEEIISGSQRLHEPERLAASAKAHGIDVSFDKATAKYIDAFRYGAPMHGGFGTGLERVVMLFCGLNNIRKTSLFPRDPLRNNP